MPCAPIIISQSISVIFRIILRRFCLNPALCLFKIGRLKNIVRGYLKAYGIRLGDVSHKKFPALVREHYADVLPEAGKEIESLLKSFEAIAAEILTLANDLKEICKQDQDVQLLMTAPGVVMIVALTYKTDLGEIQLDLKNPHPWEPTTA